MASVKDFSVEEKLVNLYRLQRVDSSIDEIEILRGELPMEVKDLEDENKRLKLRTCLKQHFIFTDNFSIIGEDTTTDKNIKIKKAVLLEQNSRAHLELKELEKRQQPALIKLIKI